MPAYNMIKEVETLKAEITNLKVETVEKEINPKGLYAVTFLV